MPKRRGMDKLHFIAVLLCAWNVKQGQIDICVLWVMIQFKSSVGL